MGARGPLAQLKLPAHLRAVPDPGAEVAESAAAAVLPMAPTMPPGLPPEVRKVWDIIVPDLVEAGLLGTVDALTVELALRHYVLAVKASNAMRTQAVSIEDRKNGRRAKNPAEVVFRSHSTAFLEYAKQMGMTFAARARLPMPDNGDDGDASGFE